tara:strand:- start:714 stop:815 length:102 start_codon:yes stop_codon:yes gene_type:complete
LIKVIIRIGKEGKSIPNEIEDFVYKFKFNEEYI